MSNTLNALPRLLRYSVGMPGKARNDPNDVRIVQYLFNKIKAIVQYEIDEDGFMSFDMVRMISQFQTLHLKFHHPDGVIDPEGKSFRGLIAAAVKAPPLAANPFNFIHSSPSVRVNALHSMVDRYLINVRHKIANEAINQQSIMLSGITGKTDLSEQDYQHAYERLNQTIDINIIKALSIVESGGRSGFNEMNLPLIAFEGH